MFQKFIHRSIWVLLFAWLGACSASAQDSFQDTIAPILAERCLACHNSNERQGDFSLQTREGMLLDEYVIAGDPDASYLIDLITPVDGEAEMPHSGEALTSEQIAKIRKWIQDGAKWPSHFEIADAGVSDFQWWSYLPLRSHEDFAPEMSDVDAFVRRSLKEHGLSPSPSADRRTLIRRLTYDLHGLPPTPVEVQSFVNDPDPQAYEKLVERLLDSPRYGERWATHWLDVVQYADTCGYDKDKLRPNAWPYRDYVIESFNNDKPWGRFIQEQVAGDVLFPETADGIVGLGFIAAGPWDFIGHVEVPEEKIDGKVARNLDRDNMVANTFNAFCSMTVQCARCHHHKHDPITQQHYYGLQAIFAALDRAERTFDKHPEITQKRRGLNVEVERLKMLDQSIDDEIEKAGGATLQRISEQIAAAKLQIENAVVLKGDRFGYHSQIVDNQKTEKWVALKFQQPIEITELIVHPCHDEFANIGAGFGFPLRFRVEVSEDGGGWSTVWEQTQSDFPNPGLEPLHIPIDYQKEVSQVRITGTRLAERSKDFVFALAELEVLDKEGRNVATEASVFSLDSIEAPNRWSEANLIDGQWPVWKQEPGEGRALLIQGQEQRAALLAKLNTPERVQRRSDNLAAMQLLQEEIAALPKPRSVYAAAVNFKAEGNFKPTAGVPREVYVLKRGEVTQPAELAVPGVLPLASDAPYAMQDFESEQSRRAFLANWLTDHKHPLVWRSIVNRVWQHHFGEGIVATPNDFGRMGGVPSHPDLLDWLTNKFLQEGQSLKYLHRLIVTSQTYRQASDFNAENAKIDSGNRFLWRMNRRRLSAEEIRDSILAASGVLNLEMGGPGFYLFELEKTEHSPHFEYHRFDAADVSTHRRSIYRFVVRSQPDPWMTTLDCADSSQSTPKRSETLTSLQALSLLNNGFNLEMSRQFATRLREAAPELVDQVDLAMGWIAQRTLNDAERKQLIEYASTHGLENLCRLMFNFSEFVYVD